MHNCVPRNSVGCNTTSLQSCSPTSWSFLCRHSDPLLLFPNPDFLFITRLEEGRGESIPAIEGSQSGQEGALVAVDRPNSDMQALAVAAPASHVNLFAEVSKALFIFPRKNVDVLARDAFRQKKLMQNEMHKMRNIWR